MALGKRSDEQQEMWVATTSLPKSQGHVFYRKLNQLLAEADFDRTVEKLCRPYYHSHIGRPSIPPGVYFRMLLVGYFEGIGSQRGIAWRCGDSLSLREFLGIPLTEETPDHSSLTRVRDRLPLEVHTAVFQLVLKLAAEKGLIKGKTVAVDSTTLEANAAMKSIVRRDTGEDWNEYLRRLLQEREGVENPTDEELRRFDRQAEGQAGIERRVDVADRPGQPHWEDEGRADAPAVQGGARRRSGNAKWCWRPRSIMAMRATRTRWSIA